MLSLARTSLPTKIILQKVPCLTYFSSLEVASVKKKKHKDGSGKKSIVVSPLVPPSQQNSRLIAGIEIHPQAATWAVLDTHLCEIVDCGTHPLFSTEVKAAHEVLLNMAYGIKESMPPAELYVFEDKPWTKGLHRAHSTMGINLLTLQGMLYALLNKDYVPETSLQNVYFIQPKAILKLFKLNVGSERSSSQCVIQKMIQRSQVSYVVDKHWNNLGESDDTEEYFGSLRWTNPDIVRRVWTRDDVWRENISNAILVAHAFNELCLKENSPARVMLRIGRL